MIIDTKFLGKVEISGEAIITFDEGILGFEDTRKYAVLDMDENSMFKCLQSVEHPQLAFIIINPWDAVKDYVIDIDDNELSSLGSIDLKDFALYTLVTINQNSITTNLVGPLIINIVSRKGKQVVLYKSSYTTKHNIIELVKKG